MKDARMIGGKTAVKKTNRWHVEPDPSFKAALKKLSKMAKDESKSSTPTLLTERPQIYVLKAKGRY